MVYVNKLTLIPCENLPFTTEKMAAVLEGGEIMLGFVHGRNPEADGRAYRAF